MNRNAKIFLGLAIFLFCCAFAFKVSLVEGGVHAEFTFANIITLMISLLAAAVAMIVVMRKAQKEDSFDADELELKELSKRSANRSDNDEFV